VKAFLTGTDTDVGKTFATALLTRALRRAGFDTVALKPVCCGDRSDVKILREAADNELDADEINPVWLRAPLAPLVAARLEDSPISLPALDKWFRRVSAARVSVLVEGAGGWLAPLADRIAVADLAAVLGLPVLLVVANRLGCINHTLLTLEAIRARKLNCQGIILNTLPHSDDPSTRTNCEILRELAGVPILFEIAPNQLEIELAVA